MTSCLPTPRIHHRGAFRHFAKRLHERIGEDQDAVEHWWRIIVAVAHENRAVMEFCGRLGRDGRRLWRYHIENARPVYVVFDHSADCPVTIMTQEKPLRCGSKAQRLIIDGVAYGF